MSDFYFRFNRQRTWFLSIIVVSLILLAGCQSLSTYPLPTVMATAAWPTAPPTSTTEPSPAPPTFTPDTIATATIASVSTQPPTTTPTPTFTPLPTTTPEAIEVNYWQPVNAPYKETPPVTTECNGPGTIFRSRFPSDMGSPWRGYHVYLPPCYGQDGRAYPVMYLIHGSIQSDSHWLDLGLARYADQGIASGRYPLFIAIMPASGWLGNMSSGGEKSIEGVTIDDLMPYIDDTYCSWAIASGRTIGGISRGGYWALEIAFRHPELFSAVSGHSSHLRFQTDRAEYNPLATFATADLSDLRIWLDRGERDFLRPGQNQLDQSLTEAGIPHEYRVNPGGHSDAYWTVHLAEYLDWHTSHWPKDRMVYPPCN